MVFSPLISLGLIGRGLRPCLAGRLPEPGRNVGLDHVVAALLEVLPARQERADVPNLEAASGQGLLDDRFPCPAAGAEFRPLGQELSLDPGQAGQFGRDQVLGLAEGLDHGHLLGLADLDSAVQLEGVPLAGQLVGQRLGQLVTAEQADVNPAVAGAVAARAADDDREREQNVISAAVVHDVAPGGLYDGQLQVLVLLVGQLAVQLVLEHDGAEDLFLDPDGAVGHGHDGAGDHVGVLHWGSFPSGRFGRFARLGSLFSPACTAIIPRFRESVNAFFVYFTIC